MFLFDWLRKLFKKKESVPTPPPKPEEKKSAPKQKRKRKPKKKKKKERCIYREKVCLTESEAKELVEKYKRKGEFRRAYHCEYGPHWHLTHKRQVYRGRR